MWICVWQKQIEADFPIWWFYIHYFSFLGLGLVKTFYIVFNLILNSLLIWNFLIELVLLWSGAKIQAFSNGINKMVNVNFQIPIHLYKKKFHLRPSLCNELDNEIVVSSSTGFYCFKVFCFVNLNSNKNLLKRNFLT